MNAHNTVVEMPATHEHCGQGCIWFCSSKEGIVINNLSITSNKKKGWKGEGLFHGSVSMYSTLQ